jgi:hypothetical protein
LQQSCNSDTFEYYDPSTSTWKQSYVDSNGATQSSISNFYATNYEVKIRTIQSSQANLAKVLSGKYGKLWITCNNGYRSCIQFVVNGTAQASVTPQCASGAGTTTAAPTTKAPTTVAPTTTTVAPTTTAVPSTTSKSGSPTTTVAPKSTVPENTCCYKFNSIQLPSIILPKVLTAEISLGSIILANGISLLQSCNSDIFEYYDPSTSAWKQSYVDVNGATQSSISNFYATNYEVKLRTLQSNQANLAVLLSGKYGRLWLTCNNGYRSCIQFVVNGTAQSTTTPQCSSGAGITVNLSAGTGGVSVDVGVGGLDIGISLGGTTTTMKAPTTSAATTIKVPTTTTAVPSTTSKSGSPSSTAATKYFKVNNQRVLACWGYDPGTVDCNVKFSDGTTKNYHPTPYTLASGYCYTFSDFGGKTPVWVQVHDFDCHYGEDNTGRTQNCYWDGSSKRNLYTLANATNTAKK